MKVTLHPAAERDVSDAAEFYQREASAALAARFVAEFKRVLSILANSPGLGRPIARGRRAFSLRVFPFAVIYRAGEKDIRILVVRHHRRHPNYGGVRR